MLCIKNNYISQESTDESDSSIELKEAAMGDAVDLSKHFHIQGNSSNTLEKMIIEESSTESDSSTECIVEKLGHIVDIDDALQRPDDKQTLKKEFSTIELETDEGLNTYNYSLIYFISNTAFYS